MAARGLEVRRCAELGDAAVAEDEDEVRVADGLDAVGDDDHGRPAADLGADDRLDLRVRVRVDGARRLVEEHDARGPQQDAREAEELALAAGEVRAALADARV